jgi:hypothetical protein
MVEFVLNGEALCVSRTIAFWLGLPAESYLAAKLYPQLLLRTM